MKACKSFFLFCGLMLVSMTAWAYEETHVVVDGVHYMISSNRYTPTARVIYPFPKGYGSFEKVKAYKQKKIVVRPYVLRQQWHSDDYDTIPVTEIAEQAFYNAKNLESVELPATLEKIGHRAFYHCKNLRSLTIPKNVESIGGAIVSGCTALTSIVVEEGNTTYDSREDCNAIIYTQTNHLIASCSQTVIPQSVQSAAPFSLDGLSITEPLFTAEHLVAMPANYTGELHIPDGVKTLKLDLLADGITALYIPASVEMIEGSLSITTKLSTIVVDENNPVYDSRNACNAILTKSNDCVWVICNGSVIPESAKAVAFRQTCGLQSITIPAGVERISNAYYYIDINNSPLTEIHMQSATPVKMIRKIREDGHSKQITLYVPKGALEAYKEHPSYQGFKEIVEEIVEE